MNELVKTRFFALLTKSSQEVKNEKMRSAYGNFMEQLKTAVSQPEMDYIEVYRVLNTTRIELAFLKSLCRYGQGEKCPKISVSSKDFSFCQF